jgi:hypothetical protein
MDEPLDAKLWCERAVKAVLLLWDGPRSQAWPDPKQHAEKITAADPVAFRPTITYNAVITFGECGLLLPDARVKDGALEAESAQLSIPGCEVVPTADAVLARLLEKDEWVEEALCESEHGYPRDKNGKPKKNPKELTRRVALLLGPLVQAVGTAARFSRMAILKEFQPRLVAGLEQVIDLLVNRLFSKPSEIFDETGLSEDPPTFSPQIILYAARAVHEWEELCKRLVSAETNLAPDERRKVEDYLTGKKLTPPAFEKVFRDSAAKFGANIAHLRRAFRAYFTRQVDRQMARAHVERDPDYDPAALAFALNGLALLDDKARESRFFRTGVAQVDKGQNPDGCWPEGVTVAYQGRLGRVRQPSVEIALQLAEAVFRPSMLFRCAGWEVALLDAALPPLERQLRYLAASFQELERGGRKYCGWPDDRLRGPGDVRVQINALAARLVNIMRLGRVARGRAATLAKYKHRWPAAPEPWRGGKQPEAIWGGVTEPDEDTTPCQHLLTKVIAPVADQMRRGYYFLRPDKDGVSFILYGPPGSGKTFLLDKFADALGWPLISLSPGDFIKKGLELIESTATEIFSDLRNLDHAVVLFDECDELFRQRPDPRQETEQGARNILSFATASMLPKLQQLHDARKVIFVLGTNYVRNLDRAVRREGRFDLILLFDRPDPPARKAHAQSVLKSAKVDPAWKTGEAEDLAEQIAELSGGWMTKQIRAFAEECAPPRKVGAKEQKLADYWDWCYTDGGEEIAAADLDDALKTKVLARWKEFIDKSPAKLAAAKGPS